MGNGLQKGFPQDDQSPGKSLHWALSNRFNKLVKLQLRRGADPNAPDKEGFAPLHAICRRNFSFDVLKHFFEVCDELHRRVRVDARDKSGRTALHYALTESYKRKVVELLLRRGADPNAADHRGMTPLHVARDHTVAQMFFDACRAAARPVRVDARDKSGRTPLQWAVADLRPLLVRLLLDHGADLSNFNFPTSDYFAKKWRPPRKDGCQSIKMSLACDFFLVYQILAVRGYNTDLMTDLMIMYFFAKHEMFIMKSINLDKRWYDNEEFAREAKKTRVNSSLSFYDLVRLRPEEAAELVSYEDHDKIGDLWGSFTLWTCLSDESKETGDAHLCEIIMRSHRGIRGARPFMDRRRCELHRRMNENLFYNCLTAADSIRDRRRESLLADFFVEMSAVIVCISLVYILSLYNIEIIKLYK